MIRDALVVGINTYKHLDKGLSAPAADAEAMAQELEQYGEFKVTRLPVFKDKENKTPRVGKKMEVNCTQLEDAIVQLFKPEGTPPDTALLYFSGHGLRKNKGITEGFLATSNVNSKDGKWGLSLQWLRRLLLESEVRQQIIILDCCYSGEMLNFAEADPGDRGKGRSRCFIAASRAYEAAYEEIDGNHSAFTSVLLKGLEPKQEQWVTNYTLINFISQHQQENRFPQCPIFTNSGEVINLTRRQTLNILDSTAKSEQAICPYKGLAYFNDTEEDAKYFYGRTALTDQLLEKVRTSNFLAILGASGSGKSSVVRAGLLYQLKLGQRLSGSNNWQIRILKPTEHPLQSLASAFTASGLSYVDGYERVQKTKQLIAANGAVVLESLIKDADTKRVVLVVDQFEEAFTLCQDIKERQQFFECLLGAARKISNKLCLVLTMRSDFFGKCTEQEYSGLAQEIQRSLVTVTPMTEEDLRRVIVQPAEQVNLKIESELVEQILKDVANAPGYLPLLEYTLTEMWKQRTDNCLRLNNYAKLGGVTVTLRQRATEVYESFSDETQKSAVRYIFISLTKLGEGTEDTRRRVCKQDLVNKKYSQQLINQVVQRLADEKLIVTEIPEKNGISGRVAVVDIAHEALIRYWPRLQEWVDKNREAIRKERKIQEAAEDWENKQKSADYLFAGLRLEAAEKFLQEEAEEEAEIVPLSNLAVEFIEESQKKRARLRQEEEERRQREQKQAISALTQASEAYLFSNRQLEALVAAVQAGRQLQDANLKEEAVLRQTVLATLQQAVYQVQERNRLEADSSGKNNIYDPASFSPDGQQLFAGVSDGTFRVWDLQGHLLIRLKGSSGVMSPDGQLLATILNSEENDSTTEENDSTTSVLVSIWDLQGQQLAVWKTHHPWGSISFSPNGQQLATGGGDATVRLWNLQGQQLADWKADQHWLWGNISFSPDGQRLATGGGEGIARVWDLQGQLLSTLTGHANIIRSVSFSPDGQRLATAGDDGTVRLWDWQGQQLINDWEADESVIWRISFSPDGQQLVTAGGNGTARLWNLQGQRLAQLKADQGQLRSAIFSPDGRLLVTSGDNGIVRLWDLQGQQLALWKAAQGRLWSVRFSPNGQLLATAGNDGTAYLWNLQGQLLSTLTGHANIIRSVSFSPDGQRLATAGDDGTVRLWDWQGEQLAVWKAEQSKIWSVSFSPDGQQLATAGGDRTVRVWDLQGQLLIPWKVPQADGEVTSICFSPDGQRLATAVDNGKICLWDLQGQLLVPPFKAHINYAWSVSFSPDGQRLATAGDDGKACLWDVQGQLLVTLKGHTGSVTSVSFSEDGQRLATAGSDGTARLWDLQGQQLAAWGDHTSWFWSVSFSPDGQLLATAGGDGNVRLWQIESFDDLMQRGCDCLRDYLKNPNNDLTQEDPLRQICDGIGNS